MTMSFETLWAAVKADVTAVEGYVENAVEQVFTAEVAVIKPTLEEELTAFSASVAANPGVTGFLAAGATLFANLSAKVPAEALTTAVTTFVSAVTTGMATAATTAITAAPTTPVSDPSLAS